MRAILSDPSFGKLFPLLIYWNASFLFFARCCEKWAQCSARVKCGACPVLSHGSGSDCWCWDYGVAPLLHRERGLSPPEEEIERGSSLPRDLAMHEWLRAHRLCTNHKELDCCEAVLWFVSNLLPSWLSLSNSRLTEFFIRAFFFSAALSFGKKCVLKFFLINYCHNA